MRFLKFFTFLSSIISCSCVFATINTANSSGLWEDGTIWSLGHTPTSAEDVSLPNPVSISINAADQCLSLSIASGATITVTSGNSLTISGNLINSGTLTAGSGTSLIFNAASNSIVNGTGTFTVDYVVLNMVSKTTVLDIQSSNFIAGINSDAGYNFTFTQGTWKYSNTATLNDCHDNGSATALTIPFNVIIESDAGTMNLCNAGVSGAVILSGKLFMNGGTVNVEITQGLNSGFDFRYQVNGGTPQLYVANGTLKLGAGFNAASGSDYIDFNMSGGQIITGIDGYNASYTFELANVVGGATVMSGGTIIMQDACIVNLPDLEMGGTNVSPYSVTGGTVQFGYTNTQGGNTWFGVQNHTGTNYPNFDFEAGVAKRVSANTGEDFNVLSVYINPNMIFDFLSAASVNFLGTNPNTGYALFNDGTFLGGTGNFVFKGTTLQNIGGTQPVNFDNLIINNIGSKVAMTLSSTCNTLNLQNGAFDINGSILTVANGAPGAVSRTNGYVLSEETNGLSKLKWQMGANTGAHIFPFGNTSGAYIPFTFNLTSGNLGDITLATYPTGTNNLPYPSGVTNCGNIADYSAYTVDRFWTIDVTTVGGGTADLTFTAAPAEVGSITNLKAEHWNTGTGQWDQVLPGQTNTAYSATVPNVANFSPWTMSGGAGALPIDLLNFTAKLNTKNKVDLNWSTASETNNDYFTIERSADGNTFESIDMVKGAGNSSVKLDYYDMDKTPLEGISYYRLKQTDFDGKFTYSKKVAIDLNAASLEAVSVYPNPFSNAISINYSVPQEGSVTMALYNLIGQPVYTEQQAGSRGINTITISTLNIPSGLYFLKLTDSNGNIKTSNLSKD